jgi:hypothetical protein
MAAKNPTNGRLPPGFLSTIHNWYLRLPSKKPYNQINY